MTENLINITTTTNINGWTWPKIKNIINIDLVKWTSIIITLISFEETGPINQNRTTEFYPSKSTKCKLDRILHSKQCFWFYGILLFLSYGHYYSFIRSSCFLFILSSGFGLLDHLSFEKQQKQFSNCCPHSYKTWARFWTV